MDKMSRIAIVIASSSLLISCATVKNAPQKTAHFLSRTQVKQTASKHYKPTNPNSILVLNNKELHNGYKIIGKVKVANYNLVGIKRQKAVINDLLQKNAAEIGGNAVVTLHANNKETLAKVVRFS